jgi:citrate synthase
VKWGATIINIITRRQAMSENKTKQDVKIKKIKTKITNLIPGKILIRGYPLNELIGNLSYSEMIYLCIKGELPSENMGKMMDALILGITDHSLVSAATPAARIVVAGNPDPIKGICAGVLSVGPVTGSPKHSARFIKNAYDQMMRNKWTREQAAENVVNECISRKERIPGFGHPLFKDVDIRAARLRELAARYGFAGEKLALYERIHEKFLEKINKKDMVINIDGMMAAIMCEMDFDEDMVDIIGVLSYLPGICAHTYEELKEKTSLGLIFQVNSISEYVGVDERHLPKERIKEG